MTDLREEIAKAVAKQRHSENCQDEWWVDTCDERMSDAIIALLRESVKPLEWHGPMCGIWSAGKRFRDDNDAYKIIWDLGKNETYTAYFGNDRLGVFSTLEAAKSSAQADYSRRILSAIGLDQ